MSPCWTFCDSRTFFWYFKWIAFFFFLQTGTKLITYRGSYETAFQTHDSTNTSDSICRRPTDESQSAWSNQSSNQPIIPLSFVRSKVWVQWGFLLASMPKGLEAMAAVWLACAACQWRLCDLRDFVGDCSRSPIRQRNTLHLSLNYIYINISSYSSSLI